MSISMKQVIKDALGIAPVLEDRSDGLSAVAKVVDEIGSGSLEDPQPTPPSEEWVWVSGYKATDKNMCCRNHQYELNKQIDMPEGSKISDCYSGFHFCLKLKDVFSYYRIGEGHRFFEVSALVRKSDLEEYGKRPEYKGRAGDPYARALFNFSNPIRDKLAAKSIIFLRELTPEEIFERVPHDNFTKAEMEAALAVNMEYVLNNRQSLELQELGFCEPVADMLVAHDKYDIAKVIGAQEGLSMDAKMVIIFCGDN